VAIIDAGKIVVLGSPDALKSQRPGNDLITLTVETATGDLADHLATLPIILTTLRRQRNVT
jgi:hypothetical protein